MNRAKRARDYEADVLACAKKLTEIQTCWLLPGFIVPEKGDRSAGATLTNLVKAGLLDRDLGGYRLSVPWGRSVYAALKKLLENGHVPHDGRRVR